MQGLYWFPINDLLIESLQGINISGFLAWWLWRTIHLSKLPHLEKRVRVALDWLLDLLLSAVGSGMATVMFLTTLTFLVTTPNAWEASQESTRHAVLLPCIRLHRLI